MRVIPTPYGSIGQGSWPCIQICPRLEDEGNPINPNSSNEEIIKLYIYSDRDSPPAWHKKKQGHGIKYLARGEGGKKKNFTTEALDDHEPTERTLRRVTIIEWTISRSYSWRLEISCDRVCTEP